MIMNTLVLRNLKTSQCEIILILFVKATSTLIATIFNKLNFLVIQAILADFRDCRQILMSGQKYYVAHYCIFLKEIE